MELWTGLKENSGSGILDRRTLAHFNLDLVVRGFMYFHSVPKWIKPTKKWASKAFNILSTTKYS